MKENYQMTDVLPAGQPVHIVIEPDGPLRHAPNNIWWWKNIKPSLAVIQDEWNRVPEKNWRFHIEELKIDASGLFMEVVGQVPVKNYQGEVLEEIPIDDHIHGTTGEPVKVTGAYKEITAPEQKQIKATANLIMFGGLAFAGFFLIPKVLGWFKKRGK